MIYDWKPGSHTSRKLNAQAVGERLESLREQHGQLTAEITVDDARPKSSPLHFAFEWDNRTAAEEYRKEQARQLIRSVVMVPDHDSGEEAKPIRAFVVISEFGEQGYTSTTIALSDPQLRAQVLARALRELRQFEHKYRELDELADVFKASRSLTVAA